MRQRRIMLSIIEYSPYCQHYSDFPGIQSTTGRPRCSILFTYLPELSHRDRPGASPPGGTVSRSIGYRWHRCGLIQLGSKLYQAAIAKFNIPTDRLGVPTLIVGQNILVGSVEIPEKLPAIIEAGLAAGGIDWPALPDLQIILAAQKSAQPVTSASTSGQTLAQNGKPEFVNRFLKDPLANSIAVVVLIGMLLSCLFVLINYLQGSEQQIHFRPRLGITSPGNCWVIGRFLPFLCRNLQYQSSLWTSG